MNYTAFRILLLFLWALVYTGCGGHTFLYQTDSKIRALHDEKPVYPSAKFIVLSDTHFYDTSLGDSGKAFQSVIAYDRKLLLQSQEIMEETVRQISRETADFLIICGDLTKDGEMVNHLGMQKVLARIAQSGLKVYVIPGNHDVANGNAVRFKEHEKIPVESVSGRSFSEIYKDFGYGQALYRDMDSLSYIAEPVPGLWILALDSCRWKENEPGRPSVSGGAFSSETLRWMEDVLIQAKKLRKAVIGMMHHGILEHYPGNENYFPMYVVQDHEAISRMLMQYGVSLMFTGHFHAQDITVKDFNDLDGTLFDIETGSLITYPSPYRVVRIQDDQRVLIESRFIASIPSHPDNFTAFSKNFLFNNTLRITDRALKKYWMSDPDSEKIAPSVATAYSAHLQGDEKKPESFMETEGLGLWGKIIVWVRKDLIEGWWTDLPPADNSIEIDLAAGKVLETNNAPD